MLTCKEIVSGDSIAGLRLSNDASRVVYSVGPTYRPNDHATSALWLALTASEGSAKQITSGLFCDKSPEFHPHGSDIYFLSDRHKAGGPAQIYRLPLNSNDGVPIPITFPTLTGSVSSFSISPDGQYLAFVSPDKPAEEGETKRKEDVIDVEIWGEKKNLGRLRLLNLADLNEK